VFYRGFPGRQAQRVGRDVELAVQVPGAGGLDFLLHRLGKLHVDLVELVQQRLGLGNAQLDIAAHVQAVVEFGFLRQVADLDTGLRARLANVIGIDAGHDAQQRRLAGAVVTQHADFCPRKKIERNILQNFGLRGHDFAHPVHGIDVLRHADCPSSECAYSNSA
jgi:hypothetical protein